LRESLISEYLFDKSEFTHTDILLPFLARVHRYLEFVPAIVVFKKVYFPISVLFGLELRERERGYIDIFVAKRSRSALTRMGSYRVCANQRERDIPAEE
jgi:hypothetical protein